MVFPAVIAAIAPTGLGLGLQAQGGPFDQFPRARTKVPPGEILQLALEIQALSERGLTPRVVTDPFTGGTVLATEDQLPILFDILGERFASKELAFTPEESRQAFEERQSFIEQRRRFPVFPGAAPTPQASPVPVVDEVREQVITNLARKSPVVVAPGVVSSPTAQSRRGLGGPCAGVTTGFQRIACSRGGFT